MHAMSHVSKAASLSSSCQFSVKTCCSGWTVSWPKQMSSPANHCPHLLSFSTNAASEKCWKCEERRACDADVFDDDAVCLVLLWSQFLFGEFREQDPGRHHLRTFGEQPMFHKKDSLAAVPMQLPLHVLPEKSDFLLITLVMKCITVNISKPNLHPSKKQSKTSERRRKPIF